MREVTPSKLRQESRRPRPPGAAVAGDLIAETDKLIRTFPGEDKCYANASEAASELTGRGQDLSLCRHVLLG